MKNRTSNCGKWLLLTILLAPGLALADQAPSKTLLPEELKLYYKDKIGYSRTQFTGATEHSVPNDNEYKENPGCYVACHSTNTNMGIYHLVDKTHVVGQVRVAGHYTNGYCLAKGYENIDIKKSTAFKEKCAYSFPARCANKSCWADIHTGNMFD